MYNSGYKEYYWSLCRPTAKYSVIELCLFLQHEINKYITSSSLDNPSKNYAAPSSPMIGLPMSQSLYFFLYL